MLFRILKKEYIFCILVLNSCQTSANSSVNSFLSISLPEIDWERLLTGWRELVFCFMFRSSFRTFFPTCFVQVSDLISNMFCSSFRSFFKHVSFKFQIIFQTCFVQVSVPSFKHVSFKLQILFQTCFVQVSDLLSNMFR